MAEERIEKVLNLYKQFSQNPSLTDARVIAIARNGINIQSYWSQRNLERHCKQKYTQEFSLDAELQPLVESFPIEVSDELMLASSENEKLKAILRRVKVDNVKKQFIEIWDRQHLVKSYDLAAYDLHGEVYNDRHFQSFHWSPDNTRLLYVAEKKLPKVEPFYKQKTGAKKPEAEETPLRGVEHFHKPNWGEQLDKMHRSIVVILNVEDDTIKPQPFIPSQYFPAQCVWTPNGEYIAGVAYKLDRNRYLGLAACTNRQSQIFLLKNTEFILITKEGLHCRSPQFSPDGKHLIWVERDLSAAHHQCLRLMRVKWETNEKIDILVDVVKTNTLTSNNKKFYGLYGYYIPKRCWTNDSKFIFLSTPQRSNIRSYLVNLETKEIYKIQNEDKSSLNILDVRKNRVIFTRTSLLKPPQLVVGKFDPASKDIGNLNLQNVTSPLDIPGSENFMYEHNEFVYKTNEPINTFNFTYFGAKEGEAKTVPLIVMPHGGPHSSFANTFSITHAVYANLGFAILQINYRGSAGMGADNIDFLLGKSGEIDVMDCVTAVNVALKKYTWLDPEKVLLYGGSYGGFLCAHLSAQHPNMFRAVVMNNPIIDIVSMMNATDIPDWCCAISGVPFVEKLPSNTSESKYVEIFLKMFNHSPILLVDKVKAPTLISVGKNDLRVPPSQGKLWYNRLRSNNIEAKLLVYDDNHALSLDTTEIDHTINTAIWMLEKLEDKLITDEDTELGEVRDPEAVDQMPNLDSKPKPEPKTEPKPEPKPEATEPPKEKGK